MTQTTPVALTPNKRPQGPAENGSHADYLAGTGLGKTWCRNAG